MNVSFYTHETFALLGIDHLVDFETAPSVAD